jgi:hypothetical protein
MNKEIDERGERWGKVKWLKEKIRDISKQKSVGKSGKKQGHVALAISFYG